MFFVFDFLCLCELIVFFLSYLGGLCFLIVFCNAKSIETVICFCSVLMHAVVPVVPSGLNKSVMKLLVSGQNRILIQSS